MAQEFIVGDVASGAAAGTAISPGVGTIIGAGLGMLGGLFGRKADKRNQAAQNAREDSRFQRASKDAKAAGLHPLFALGAAGAGSPQFIAGQSETGSSMGDALKTASRAVPAYAKATKTNPLAAKLASLQIQNAEINIRKSLIDEQMMASELRRTFQQSTSEGFDKEFPTVEEQMHTPSKQDIVEHPVHQKISLTMPGGSRIIIGESATAEEIEDIFGDLAGALYMVPKGLESAYLTIKHNAKKKGYGPKFDQMIAKAYQKHKQPTKYKKITGTQAFKARVRGTASTRKRIY